MSVAYIYLNPDKGQFFHCGLLGYASSFSAIGSGPGARALAILLSERGTWRNDRIAVVGDTAEEFDDVHRNAVDIEVEVELMLLEIDGLAWGIDCRIPNHVRVRGAPPAPEGHPHARPQVRRWKVATEIRE